MANAGEIAARYFEAVGRQDLDAAVSDAGPVTGDVVGQLTAAADQLPL